MKATHSISAITLIATVMGFAIHAFSASPVKSSEARRDGAGMPKASAKNEARKGGEWFADPERGWVRIDGRRDVPQGAHPSNSSKAKTKKAK
jgi:hypothetical protein